MTPQTAVQGCFVSVELQTYLFHFILEHSSVANYFLLAKAHAKDGQKSRYDVTHLFAYKCIVVSSGRIGTQRFFPEQVSV